MLERRYSVGSRRSVVGSTAAAAVVRRSCCDSKEWSVTDNLKRSGTHRGVADASTSIESVVGGTGAPSIHESVLLRR